MATQTTMSEQEIITDLLTSEKHVTSTVNTFITESTCANLRQNLKTILDEEHNIHENLYNIMNSKGWYPATDAEAQEVQKAKDKFKPLQ
ncbi:spore coat protein [Desulfosporosinus sp. FKA]|uniref:Coat F domain protein n=2 Tax=Desulfosporosinus acididurans TaxID=476652 RepID=A0A0J1FV54_9FIRM|nr:spore coat protein [Desulfosporosinus sp. FKA]KLU66868.1 coat F domain protein [Desulfosporosinus acididurans]